MSDQPETQAPAAAPPPGAPAIDGAGPGCPLSPEFLPPNMRKHVDPKAPVPLRMMAAKTLIPLSPSDMLGALFMLTFDPDAGVREAAEKSAAGLPDRILATALRDEGVAAPVLGFFLEKLAGKEMYAEMLILNATTPDEAVAKVAKSVSAKVAEIISQNQLRILRHEEILRQLVQNPNASPAMVDLVCDFAVRSGMQLLDLPQMKAARIRLYGPEVEQKPPDPGPTAEEIVKEYAELKDEAAPPLEEGKKLSLTQRIMKMSISQKIKLATLGNKEARTLLFRDPNKLVCVAAIRSPRITDGEVLLMAGSRAVNEEVLRVIYSNREWVKKYPVKLALVKNPKIPLGIAMKFLNTLRESEMKDLARDKNVPQGIASMAKKMLDKKNTPKRTDDK